MQKAELETLLAEVEGHLIHELLPFWLARCRDERHGGYITHFDNRGNDTGTDEKSLISQARTLYTMSSLCRSHYGDERTRACAEHGLEFLLNRLWDGSHGGFCWMADRKGAVVMDNKVLYGQAFAVYALSYLEMFDRRWRLAGPGPQGGDRKTLDVHMHLMEAFTTLYECTGEDVHRRGLLEVIGLLRQRMLDPRHGTGIPQFTVDWQAAAQIKFDVVWGWDRFAETGRKADARDNTSYGHNAELAWLLNHAAAILALPEPDFAEPIRLLLEHCLRWGIDREYGGVFVEGPHDGPARDLEKEFWQQAEALVAMLDGYILFGEPEYLKAYRSVHRFVMDKVVNRGVGEWWPLPTREGRPIWTHMAHSWKINYHTVRSMVQSADRLRRIIGSPGAPPTCRYVNQSLQIVNSRGSPREGQRVSVSTISKRPGTPSGMVLAMPNGHSGGEP